MSIAFVDKGLKGAQGGVFSGPIPQVNEFSQSQYHAPLKAAFKNLPNGRIVSLDATNKGWLKPGVQTTANFTMPLIVQEGGSNWNVVPQTVGDTPYFSASPAQGPVTYNTKPSGTVTVGSSSSNVNTIPLCTGFEFFSTEYNAADITTALVPGETALTAYPDNTADLTNVGKLKVATATDVVVGILSALPGVGRVPYVTNNTQAFGAANTAGPNAQASVTGVNKPVLRFWGFPQGKGVIITVTP